MMLLRVGKNSVHRKGLVLILRAVATDQVESMGKTFGRFAEVLSKKKIKK